jgi:hypothetical protein
MNPYVLNDSIEAPTLQFQIASAPLNPSLPTELLATAPQQPAPLPGYPLIVFAPDHDEDAAAPKPIQDDDFENRLMDLVLSHEKRVLSAPMPIRVSSLETTSHPLPSISRAHLPLNLSDPYRKYPSAIPGLLLTHPHGSVYGGAIPYSRRALREEIADIMEKEGIQTKDALIRHVRREMESARRQLVRNMKARRAVRAHNDRVDEQLQALEEDREEEINTEKRWRRERDNRERRRRDARKF